MSLSGQTQIKINATRHFMNPNELMEAVIIAIMLLYTA